MKELLHSASTREQTSLASDHTVVLSQLGPDGVRKRKRSDEEMLLDEHTAATSESRLLRFDTTTFPSFPNL